MKVNLWVFMLDLAEKKMREGLCLREGIKDQSQMLLHRALDLQEIKKVEKVRQRLCLK